MKLFGKYQNVKEMLAKEDKNVLQQKFPHGKPMSRRDLLQAGAIGFAATVTLPPFLGMLAKPEQALAQAACEESQLPGFITMNLSGGAAMGSNILPLTQSRQMLGSYSILGLGSTAAAASLVDTEFGGTKFYVGSGMLQGIRDATALAPLDSMGRTALANTAAMVIWCTSQNDSNNNKFAADGMITAIRNGKLLQNLGTQSNEPAGIGQKPAFKAPVTPVVIGNSGDIDRALGVNGIFSNERADGLNLSQNQKYEIARTIASLSSEQCKKIQGANGAHELCQLLEQASGLNVDVISSDEKGTDPLSDPLLSAILNNVWTDMNNNRQQGNTLANLNAGSMTRVGAFLTYNVLKGNAATAGIDLGGYDYHGAPTRQTTDNQDYRAGWMMGQALATAHVMQKPLFLMVTSDGAVSSPSSDTSGVDFSSDYGQGSGIYIFAYDPKGRPEVSDNKGAFDYQVGHFKEGTAQGVDDSFIVGGNPERAAMVAFLNYCTFSGQPQLVQQVLGGEFNASQIDLLSRIKKRA